MLALLVQKVVLQEKTSFAKSAIAPTPKALNSALNAASFHAKQLRKDPLALGTANSSVAKAKNQNYEQLVLSDWAQIFF